MTEPTHPQGHVSLTRELRQDLGDVNVYDVLLLTLDRTARPWRYPDPNPMPRITLFPIPGRARSRAAARPRWWARPVPSPGGSARPRHRRECPSPGAAGNPPRSAPGRRAPRYHHLRDLS